LGSLQAFTVSAQSPPKMLTQKACAPSGPMNIFGRERLA
jgi:hypothetical protein